MHEEGKLEGEFHDGSPEELLTACKIDEIGYSIHGVVMKQFHVKYGEGIG